MARYRTSALAENRETDTEELRSPDLQTAPTPKPAQTPWRVATLLWGFPLLFFIVVAVLKECVGVSVW